MDTQTPVSNWLIRYCMDSASESPVDLLEELLADAQCDTFGPVHHLAAGAALLTGYYNALLVEDTHARDDTLFNALIKLEERAASVPGASCAHWGVCGAAISIGMAYALINDSKPLKEEGWSEGQLLVASILERIAQVGGPRCCKRDARLAVEVAITFFANRDTAMQVSFTEHPACVTAPLNKVCKGKQCPYSSSWSHPKQVRIGGGA